MYLEKKGKKNIQFCSIEPEEKLLRIKIGIIGKTVSSSTRNCGTPENALDELNKIANDYKLKGYKHVDKEVIPEDISFDKAKWHLNSDYPEGLDQYQAYLHTGFFIGWLINNDLINDELEVEFKKSIEEVRNNKLNATQFYKDQLDGVFSSSELNHEGFEFTKYYYKTYLKEYENTLGIDVKSIFYVRDNAQNFSKISEVINRRFKEWKDGLSRP